MLSKMPSVMRQKSTSRLDCENKNGNTETNKHHSKCSKAVDKSNITQVLREWFLENINFPYPEGPEREKLLQQTGMSRVQLRNWFTNSRKRSLKPIVLDNKEPATEFEYHIFHKLKALGEIQGPNFIENGCMPLIPKGHRVSTRSETRGHIKRIKKMKSRTGCILPIEAPRTNQFGDPSCSTGSAHELDEIQKMNSNLSVATIREPIPKKEIHPEPPPSPSSISECSSSLSYADQHILTSEAETISSNGDMRNLIALADTAAQILDSRENKRMRKN